MLLRFVSYSMIFDMAQIHTTQSDDLQTSKRFHVSIGLRLSLAFILVILLTGLIGLLAIQQFSSLTNTTTELNSHDLPEAITLVHLRSLLYRQRDLEFNLINAGNPHVSQSSYPSQPEDLPAVAAGTPQRKQAQQTLSELASMLKEIAADRSSYSPLKVLLKEMPGELARGTIYSEWCAKDECAFTSNSVSGDKRSTCSSSHAVCRQDGAPSCVNHCGCHTTDNG